jgi:hypothetical protein
MSNLILTGIDASTLIVHASTLIVHAQVWVRHPNSILKWGLTVGPGGVFMAGNRFVPARPRLVFPATCFSSLTFHFRSRITIWFRV